MDSGDYLEVTVDLKNMNKANKTNNVYWTTKCGEVVKGVCALLNSFGGKLRVNIEDQNVDNFENVLDSFLRAIGQRLRLFISLVLFNQLVKMPNRQDKEFVYEISVSDEIFTMKYNLYLPTLKQVEEIPPHQPNALKRIREVCNISAKSAEDDLSKLSGFIVGKSVLVAESDRLQFKCVFNGKSKRTTIADRIVANGNKLIKTVSAFANHAGGHVLFGISNDGIVQGQHLSENEKREVEAKVTKEISKLIWVQKAVQKGEHWNIDFIPVEDDKNNAIDSLFIIKISIKALPGGVFVQQPESYHIGLNREVKRMSFGDWKSRIIFGFKPVLASVSRIDWSSPKAHRKYFTVIFELNDLQNEASYEMFKKLAISVKEQHRGTATELFVMIIESVVAYKRGMMKKANEIVSEVEATLKNHQNIDDHQILMFRMLYAKSAIARAKGDYDLSYKYARDAHHVADQIQPGVLTAWFFNHVAIVEKFLSHEQKRLEEETKKMKKSSLEHYVKALQYAKASNVEQEFAGMIADLEQRVHIFRAISILGNFATGTNLSEVTPSNIKAAENDLLRYKSLEIAGFLPTNYRRTYCLFAESDLRFAQWYQKLLNQRLQQQEQQQVQQQQHEGVYKMCSLLKDARSKALEARNLSKKCRFEELTEYANRRLGKITEMMVKFNFVSTLSKRRSTILAIQ